MIVPIPLLAIILPNTNEGITEPLRLRSDTFLKASIDKSNMVCSGVIVAPGIFPPAALMRISTVPHLLRTSSLTSSKLSWSKTFPAKPMASPPRPIISWARDSAASLCKSKITTFTPASARLMAMLPPNTPPPPVITATLPVKSNKFLLICYLYRFLKS